MTLHQMTYHLIGEVYGRTYSLTGSGTARCRHKCHQKAVPLCQMPLTESNPQEIICPLKNPRRRLLSRLFQAYPHLKNAYTLLWDMPSNDGYIKVTAVIQKFFDQAISGNWSYNPENYDGNEVPTSEMAQGSIKYI